LPSANESHAASAAAATESPSRDEPTVLLRKLGSAGVPTYLERVLTQGGEHQFVVVERLARGHMTEEETSDCLRDARMAAGLEHPNVVRTRAIKVRPDEISVVSDYVAGERLSELWSPASGSARAVPVEIALRILVDVATGLGALHKLRSAEGHDRLKFVHGEVTDSNVLVGLDGVSLVLRASRVRRGSARPKMDTGTIAPEVMSGQAVDQRADVYSLGAMLWQALSSRPLVLNHDIEAMRTSAKEGTVARAVVARGEPWALPLADVVARALSPAPEKRFPTASSMVTELRKIAGSKLATTEQVAQFVEAAAGAKIAARLADVQASAVIRKAISIPASTLPTQQEKDGGDSTQPVGTIAKPVETSSESKAPIDAVTAVMEKAVEVSPRIEAAPPRAVLPPPSDLPTLVKPRAEPADRPNQSPPVPSKPVSIPRQVKATPERARVDRPRVVSKASPVVVLPEPTGSPLARLGTRWAIGAWLAIALITGWFAFQAIRNRQDITTPAGALQDSPAMLGPASSAVGSETATGTRGSGSVVPEPGKPAPATTTPPRARPVTSSEPRKVPMDVQPRSREVPAPRPSSSRPADIKPRQK
jgi:serine/threonine protein kinase